MEISIVGSTGLVGKSLVSKLLKEDSVQLIKCLNRRETKITASKYHEIVQDELDPENVPEYFYSSDVFICCLGSTIKKSKTHVAFEKIDTLLPLDFATLFKRSLGAHFILLSALGANPDSNVFYNRCKGKTESTLKKYDFKQLSIVRPSLLLGKREESRPTESIMQQLMPLFVNPLLHGPFKKYRAVRAEHVAELIVSLALNRLIESSTEYLTFP